MKRKFFAAFLSLCMVMSLVPMTALAAEESWTEVSTAEELSSALVAGGNIKLTENITVTEAQAWTVGNGVNVVLDLNGYSITSTYNEANYYLFTVNGGSLTLNDSSETRTGKIEIQNASQSYPLHLRGTGSNFIMNGGTITATEDALDISTFAQDTTITINGGTMSSQSYSALAIRGTNTVVNINGGLIENNGHCGAFVSSSGSLDPNSIVFNMTDGKLTSTGTGILTDYALTVNIGEEAAIETAGTGISVKGTTVLNVDGGSITSGSYAIQANYNNTVNITGGKIQTTSTYAPAIQIGTDSNATISGGTITGKKVLTDNTEDITVTGGTFTDGETKVDVSTYFPEGAILTQDKDGHVVPGTPGEGRSAVAEVNGVPYTSLQSALNMARDGDTVTLLKDETLNATITVDKTVTIDLNQRTVTGNAVRAFHVINGTMTLTGTGTVTSTTMQDPNSSVIRVGNNGTAGTTPAGLVVGENVVIKAPETYGISVFGNATEETLTVNGTVTATGPAPAISGNGMYDGTTITIGETANISASQSVAIYHPQGGTLTINGGIITGGIEAKSGTITINGNPSISAVGEKNHTANGNGPSTTGYAIAIVDNSAYGNGATITINSGSYNGPVEYLKDGNGVGSGNESGSITVSGGHFSAPVSKEYLANTINAELYSLRNTEAPYSYYPTVDAAQAAAQPGDVVTDLSDVNASTTTRYDVVFHHGNGTTQTLSVYDGATITLPTLSNRGYNHFVGWTDQAGKHYDGGDTVTITANTIFTAVWNYIPPANPNYRIDIPAAEGGTVTADPAAAKAGATVTLTATPDEGYALGTITVTDRFGDAVKVTENADGTYTFTMPNGQVTVTATFVQVEEPAPTEPFVDVAEGDWFYDAVVYAYQNELMDGVGGSRFAPNSETTRAQLVTILYRLEGEPTVSGDLPFTDVEAGIWYTDAILWAAQNNIVNGVSDTEFAPGDDLTRQQLVTILYRYAEAKGYDVSASADLSGYPDADQVQDYAQPAMAWAVAENIIQGMEDGTLKPAGNASRAQIATILMRFCEDVAQ